MTIQKRPIDWRLASLTALGVFLASEAQAGDSLRPSFFVDGTRIYEDIAIRFQGDPFCNQTWAEVPKPRKLKDLNMDDPWDELDDRVIIVNGMLAAMVSIDASGAVTDAVVKPGWPGSDRYLQMMQTVAKDWQFEPGAAGIYCMRIFVDADGEVLELFKEPKKPAPKPSVATEIPYPELAYENKVSGNVIMSIDIDKTGKVTEARVIGEEPLGYAFGLSAQETVQAEWHFAGAEPGRYRLKLSFAP